MEPGQSLPPHLHHFFPAMRYRRAGSLLPAFHIFISEILIVCRRRPVWVAGPRTFSGLFSHSHLVSSLLIDIRFFGLFVAVLKKPIPFNDAHFLSDTTVIDGLVPAWHSPVKDTDFEAINVLACHNGSMHGRSFAG
jgi:hypothetical protein